jgi:hypothetical protein
MVTSTTEVESRRTAVLLPLASGLAVAALAQLTVSPAVLLVHVAVLLASGALLAERPVRTAALVEAPSLALGVGALALGLGTVERSWLRLALLVAVAAPLVLSISYFVVKTGTALRQEWQERAAVPSDPAAGPPGGLGIFATKSRRGAFLIGLMVILSVGLSLLSGWSGSDADRLASERAAEIEAALAGQTPQSLQTSMVTRSYTGEGESIVGGRFRRAGLEGNSFVVVAEVTSGLQHRCIRVSVGPETVAHSEIRDGTC